MATTRGNPLQIAQNQSNLTENIRTRVCYGKACGNALKL